MGKERVSNYEYLDRIISIIIRYEGGPKYTNHPADRGGPTKFGITQGAWTSYCNRMRLKTDRRNVKHITIDDARAFYANLFNNSASCPYLPTPGLQLFTFDCCVLHGPKRAGVLLQRSLNDIIASYTPNKARLLEVDGIVGPKTLEAAELIVKGERDSLMEMFRVNRTEYIRRIIAQDKSQLVFYRGWVNRVNQCKVDADALDLENGLM